MPFPGVVLEEATRYAVVVTSALTDRAGAPLRAPPALRELATSAPDANIAAAPIERMLLRLPV